MKIFKVLATSIVFLSTFMVGGCSNSLTSEDMYGEYSIMLNNIEYVLIIAPDGTFKQKEITNGTLLREFNKKWEDISEIGDETRFVLQGFVFPTRKNGSEWPAVLERRWGKLSLCYFDEKGLTKCFVKRKSQ